MFYYTYTVRFEDGTYYHGSRISQIPPEQDTGYFGSPVSNKLKWESKISKSKIIEAVFNSIEEMQLAESLLIGDKHRTDPNCLNRHNTKTFSCAGLKWINNGIEEKYCSEVPEGFILGRLGGRTLSEEHKLAISQANKGKVFTQSHRENISKYKRENAHLMSGANNIMYIKSVAEKHAAIMATQEYKAKMSEAVKASWTEEKRIRHSEIMKNRKPYKNPASKTVVVNGVQYNSIAECMNTLKVPRKWVLSNGNFS